MNIILVRMTGLLGIYWCIFTSHIVLGFTRREEWGKVSGDVEYCDHESFQAQCSSGELIQILTAEYGHIKLGKCIKVDLGYLGCKADVSIILARRCNGKSRCEMSVVDETLKNTQPCTSGLEESLSVSYACIKAFPGQQLCGSLSARPEPQYLPSMQLYGGSCPGHRPVQIRAQPGQHINLTLISLDQTNEGHTVGLVADDQGTQWDLTTHGRPEQNIAVSNTHSLSVVLDSTDDNPKFVIMFQALGCPDITAPRGTVVERSGQEATVSCPYTDQTWTLQCRGYHWLGVIGNCTRPAPIVVPLEASEAKTASIDVNLVLPKDVIYLIMACATVFLSILVVTTGYVCLKKAQIQNQPKVTSEPEWLGTAQMTLLNKSRPNSDYMTPQYVPEAVSQPQPAIYDTPLPDPPVVSTATRNTVKRNNEEDYTASLSSNSTDYTRKYFVLDKDYVNTKNLINI